jgi:hypothetical protein
MRPFNQDVETVNPETPTMAQNVENAEDEANILTDQDETLLARPTDTAEYIGSDGTDADFGLELGEFARGEVDVKEQMDRTMANMDAGHHRPRHRHATPHSNDGRVDTAEAIQNGLSNHKQDDTEKNHKPASRGHETGAYTDIGAGRSGVTRQH